MSLKSLSQNNQSEYHLASQPSDDPTAQSSALFEDILSRDLSLRVKVTGGSMAPFLRSGEILTIKKVPCSSLHIGDLIFFKTRDGLYILHRIVRKGYKKNELIFETKGDSLFNMDEPVCESEVLGKVCRIERIVPGFKTKHVDMEMTGWRAMNLLCAQVSLSKFKISSHRSLYGLLRRIKKAFV